MQRIGWIGLGRIGKPMVEALISDGFNVAVFDVAEAACNAFADQRVRIGNSAADVARDADAVIFCVSDGKAVEDVSFGPSGIIKQAQPGTLIIDHSSTHPELTRELGRMATDRELNWVDAPISGGPVGAVSRRLAAWLGGDPHHCAAAKVILKSYCSGINYMGPCGSGQVAKSCNQAIVANTIAIWAEMLEYAKGNNLDLLNLIETLSGSSADSSIRKAFAKEIACGQFPDLSTRNMVKDLQVISELAAAADVSMPHSKLTLAEFEVGIARNFRVAEPEKPV